MKDVSTSGFNVKTISFGLLAALTVTGLQAEEWSEMSGEATLRKFVSGATASIEVSPGVIATGKYLSDGSAVIEAWGEDFTRTWRVEGDDQVCYSSTTETNCFTFEQSKDDPKRYRANRVSTGESTYFVLTEDGKAAGSSQQDGGLGTPSAEEIAAELSNPNTTMGSMLFNFDYISFKGDLPKAGNQSATRITFQPSLPYPLNESTNIFMRPAIPVIVEQDVPAGSLGNYDTEKLELGDISFDLAIAKTLPGGLMVLGGVVGTLPTATADNVGRDQWMLGPEALVALVRPWGVAGLLLSHKWDVAGEDDYDTSITGGQYFYAFNLGGGWQVNGSPTFSYNHEARNHDNRFTFPLAVGVSRTLILKGRPWKFGVQYWHYIESPDDFGPDFQVRFNITPVVALPW